MAKYLHSTWYVLATMLGPRVELCVCTCLQEATRWPEMHRAGLVLVTQSCWTLCDPMDCSPPDSSVHGILQARILAWVAVPFSRGSSQPRDWTGSPALQADSLLSEPPGKPQGWSTLSKLCGHTITKGKSSKPFIIGYYTRMGEGSLRIFILVFPFFNEGNSSYFTVQEETPLWKLLVYILTRKANDFEII